MTSLNEDAAPAVHAAPRWTRVAVEVLAAEKRVEMPITRAVSGVLFRGVSPREALQQLLARDPREEV